MKSFASAKCGTGFGTHFAVPSHYSYPDRTSSLPPSLPLFHCGLNNNPDLRPTGLDNKRGLDEVSRVGVGVAVRRDAGRKDGRTNEEEKMKQSNFAAAELAPPLRYSAAAVLAG